ncbi:MAG: ABC transporter ATP-binding protein [Rhodococcus sp.]|nr:ABC transporter ATP-binding protein [Rhodococcus sp. (in: high G+C Gram-positive bacteria)]
MTASVAVSVLLLRSGHLTYSDCVALLVLSVALSGFAMNALPFGVGLDMAERALEHLSGFVSAPTLPEPQTPAQVRDSSIEFDAVTYTYPGSESPVLDRVSFHIPAGSVTAIVGPSGAGKTTITRLMARFVDADSGTVRIGGVDVREIGSTGVLEKVAVVFQDAYLFEGTLRDNIRLGSPDATDADIDEVAALAGVDVIAQRLPAGLDTVVGEGGNTLSGGERQRVSIARAFAKKAPIVLLDEATASLDVDSEATISQGIEASRGAHTIVVVAHRMHTVRAADHIIVLDGQGGLDAAGTHDELVAGCERYRRFCAERTETAAWSLAGGPTGDNRTNEHELPTSH